MNKEAEVVHCTLYFVQFLVSCYLLLDTCYCLQKRLILRGFFRHMFSEVLAQVPINQSVGDIQ